MMEIVKDNSQNHNFELHRQQFIMMGGLINTKAKTLSDAEIKKMKSKYVAMYFGFVSINWGMGKTLGESWQKALEQMYGFVMSKMKIANHPMATELMKFHREYCKSMAKTIMTNPNVDLKLPEHLKKNFIDYGTERVKESKAYLNELYQKYTPTETLEQNPNTNKFNPNQNLYLILKGQCRHQRAA